MKKIFVLAALGTMALVSCKKITHVIVVIQMELTITLLLQQLINLRKKMLKTLVMLLQPKLLLPGCLVAVL